VTAVTAAPPERVFDLLADGNTWPTWSPIERFELEREGDPPPDGVGAIRVYRRGRTVGRDETTELVPGRRFAYRSLSGLPVRDYRGQVELESRGDGTLIRWSSSFDAKVPGTGALLRRGIAGFLQDCADGLAAHAVADERSA
jgi:uncharacterized protein YndB with AHSA1/START domain